MTLTIVADVTKPHLQTAAGIATYNRAVGTRIKEARTLAELSQSELAKAVGIDSTEMVRIERGIDLEDGGAPPWVLQRIAIVCGVKGDFLLCLTEESEPDEPGPSWREIAWLCNQSACRARERHVADLFVRDEHLAEFHSRSAEVLDGIEATQAAIERVIELNPRRWDNVKGGVRLVNAIEALEESANGLVRRSRLYVERDMIADSPETLTDLEIISA